MRSRRCASQVVHVAVLPLADARQGGAQSQEVVAARRDEPATVAFTPRRLVTVVSSALLKRKVGRIGVANRRLFDEADAMTWLTAEDTCL